MASADTLPTSRETVSTGGSSESAEPVNNGGLTAVGDSVLLGTRFRLEQSIRGVQTDAEVGRLAPAVLQRVRELRAEQLLAPTVLVHLGTNGYVPETQLRRALADLGDRHRVIIVNAHAPRRWVADNNEMIARVVRAYPNAVLVDWAAMSSDRPEFFASDDIHLTARGQAALVTAIIHAGGFPATPPRDTDPALLTATPALPASVPPAIDSPAPALVETSGPPSPAVIDVLTPDREALTPGGGTPIPGEEPSTPFEDGAPPAVPETPAPLGDGTDALGRHSTDR